jgi:squalene cyclase
MHAEDLQTNYVNIGPVSKVMHLLVAWREGGNTHVGNAEFHKHVLRVPDYLWVAEDGMKMSGYNGSQCWDTAFAAQACVEAGLGNEFPLAMRRAYGYFERTQILSTSASQASDAALYETEEMRRKYYRHVSLGGWPFSTSAHGACMRVCGPPS